MLSTAGRLIRISLNAIRSSIKVSTSLRMATRSPNTMSSVVWITSRMPRTCARSACLHNTLVTSHGKRAALIWWHTSSEPAACRGDHWYYRITPEHTADGASELWLKLTHTGGAPMWSGRDNAKPPEHAGTPPCSAAGRCESSQAVRTKSKVLNKT